MIARRQYEEEQPARGGSTMLDEIRADDFSLIETALYLDANPESAEALSYYRGLKDKREKLRKQYETSVGPLTAAGNEASTWEWTKDPWPWEPEAN